MKVHLLNAPICHTADVQYVTRFIDRAGAIRLCAIAAKNGDLHSAIGHDGTARVLSLVLDQPIAVNRVSMQYSPGDIAIALQLRQRQPEGVVLTAEQVEAIGYELTLIETGPAPVCVVYGSAVEAWADKGPVPSDINVAYAGMDTERVRHLVSEWLARISPHLQYLQSRVDMHPELVQKYDPTHDATEGMLPARYRVSVPYPDGAPAPSVVVLGGKPEVVMIARNNLASLMRRLGRDATTLDAGRELAGWVANNRDGLRIDMTVVRAADDQYKEGTLAGLRAGWRHVAPSFSRGQEILAHVDGYIDGLGAVLGVLLKPMSRDVLAQVAVLTWHRPEDVESLAGVIHIHRRSAEPQKWVLSIGDMEMPLREGASWLGQSRVW